MVDAEPRSGPLTVARAWYLLGRWPVVTLAAVTVLLSLMFRLWPGLDVWFSRGFYAPEIGFPASLIPIALWLRGAADTLVWMIVVVLLLAVLLKLVLPSRRSIVSPRSSLFLLSTLALGPGLLVNAILKEVSGRPRPTDITAFGGDQPYVPVWEFTDLCTGNCSFVAGEASSAIWLVAVALLAPPRWRRAALATVLAVAALLSLNRIAFGAHFLSDVLIAWSLTLLLIAIAYHFIYVAPPRWLREEALEAAIERAGRGIGRLGNRAARMIGPAPIPPDRNRARRPAAMRGEGDERQGEGQRRDESGGGGPP